jgi:mycofactocin precursor peptide peptidase
MTRLSDLTWTEVAARAPSSLLVVPLGATEQHGPHLPLSTDADIAVAIADSLADVRDDVLVAPALAYGASGEHAGFAGTLSIGTSALTHVLVELVRSADAFRGIVLVAAHGGNRDAVDAAVELLTDECRFVLAWRPHIGGGDAHAGRTETSLMLALDRSVDVDRAEAGATQPLGELMTRLVRGGVASVSANGVLGDPAGASAAEGHALFDALTADLVASVAAWLTDPSR